MEITIAITEYKNYFFVVQKPAYSGGKWSYQWETMNHSARVDDNEIIVKCSALVPTEFIGKNILELINFLCEDEINAFSAPTEEEREIKYKKRMELLEDEFAADRERERKINDTRFEGTPTEAGEEHLIL